VRGLFCFFVFDLSVRYDRWKVVLFLVHFLSLFRFLNPFLIVRLWRRGILLIVMIPMSCPCDFFLSFVMLSHTLASLGHSYISPFHVGLYFLV